ncbi:hypothetical protein GCM10009771_21210 [Nesterenkonia flava]
MAGNLSAESASLYILSYYGGSSVLGYGGGWFYSWAGWSGSVGMVAGLVFLAGFVVAVVLSRQTSHPPTQGLKTTGVRQGAAKA